MGGTAGAAGWVGATGGAGGGAVDGTVGVAVTVSVLVAGGGALGCDAGGALGSAAEASEFAVALTKPVPGEAVPAVGLLQPATATTAVRAVNRTGESSFGRTLHPYRVARPEAGTTTVAADAQTSAPTCTRGVGNGPQPTAGLL